MMIVNVRNGVGRLTMSNNDLRLSWSDTERNSRLVTMPM